MSSLKKFERKCTKLKEIFLESFSSTQSFNKRFQIFNRYVEDFKKIALKTKPHINSLDLNEYNKTVYFFINVCVNEMTLYLTMGTSFYNHCSSPAESLSHFKKRLFKISHDIKVSGFLNFVLYLPSKQGKLRTVSLLHVLNSDKVETINNVFVPYYSIVFDSNLSSILENCVRIRISNVL